MGKNWTACAVLAMGVAASTGVLTATAWGAESPDASFDKTVPPRMSYPTAKYFSTHPAAYARFLAQLPHRSAATVSETRFATSTGGTWQLVREAPGSLTNPLLLTDGTVIAANGDTPYWYKLTPDSTGNYAKGTWSKIAALPVVGNDTKPYAPLYHASAVLPDGRVIIMGGEYNHSNQGVWTNEGAIYDPVADSWTPVAPPLGTSWRQIGDAQSTVLADGSFMLASCCAYYPPVDALLDPKSLTWKPTGAPRFGGAYQDEQGYELLANGDVLTVDIWTTFPNGNPTNAEKYVPSLHEWVRAGNTPVSIVDPEACGNFEIGPAVLRGDGSVVAFGGNTGCVTGATADPTVIYSAKGAWSAGPNVPAVCGSDGATSCDLADAPAALLPDGNVLFAASAGYGGNPTHFFEFTSANSINQVSDTLKYASEAGAYYYNFLELPNGQILATDFSKTAEVYTPAGTPVASWAPVIYNVSSTLSAGHTYTLVGAQLNGRSQGAYYGDDAQAATNYPIIRIANVQTGDVFYARSFGFSTMSVAAGTLGKTKFTIQAGAETGDSLLEVVTNGIASKPVLVTVK
jgi:hypothetical protein